MVQLMPVGLEMTLPLPVPRPVMVSLLELASDSDGRVISVASWQPKTTPTRNTRLIAATFFIRKRTFTLSAPIAQKRRVASCFTTTNLHNQPKCPNFYRASDHLRLKTICGAGVKHRTSVLLLQHLHRAFPSL